MAESSLGERPGSEASARRGSCFLRCFNSVMNFSKQVVGDDHAQDSLQSSVRINRSDRAMYEKF